MRLAPIAMLAMISLAACTPADAIRGGGDPERGKSVITSSQCGACHQIPGVVGADGRVGPPLGGFANRTIIAGLLPNTPANLVRWLRTPQAVKPGDAMPDTGLTNREANDVAAYLQRLH